MAVIKSTDLDFDQIKQSLKTYFQAQSEFTDYDFDAAGLSNLLDVLAYNTHMNGLVANMAINESFLSSAQIRASVTSHAESLGYYPRSKTASTANVGLTISTNNTQATSISIPQYTTFTTSIDQKSYTFRTLETYVANNNGSGLFTVTTDTGSPIIPIREGSLKTKTFIVGDTDDDNVYVIPDVNMDTTTVTVKVYDTTVSTSYSVYTNISNSVRVNTDSRVYIIREAPNGYYEMIFGEGSVLGVAPTAGNKIEIQYLSTSGADANNGVTFIADDQVTIDTVDYTLTVTHTGKSAGGADKETIQSIKANAPISFATQQRLVTVEDYKALIQSKYSSVVTDVTAWGGNDNIPPEFGKVFVSLNFVPGTPDSIKQATKDSIVTDVTNNLAIMSIDTKFVDPVIVYLQLSTVFNFDPDLSGNTVQFVQGQVATTIADYINTNLNTFDKVFRRSLVLAEVDNISPAILNSRMAVKMQMRFTPTLNTLKDYTISFPTQIALPDDQNHRITSTRFTFNNQSCYMQNLLNTNKLQIIGPGNTIVKDNVGFYNANDGTVNIRGLNVSAFEGTQIKISAVPANESTVRPLRGYILGIDNELSVASGIIDTQNTSVVI